MEPFELTDGTVLLRSPGPQDVDAIFEACQDPEIQSWTSLPTPYLREHAESFVREMVPNSWRDGGMNCAIRDLSDSERLVGMIGLAAQPVRSAEIGWWLAPQARGRGLMGRSVSLVLDAAFDRYGLDRVEWRAYVGNHASWAVAARVGFRREATVRLGAVKGDTRRDDWIGTLLRDDPRPDRP